MSELTVIFGFMAPPMKEQFPELNDNDAYHFDQDNVTLCRLKLRGLISSAESRKARSRLCKAISKALKDKS